MVRRALDAFDAALVIVGVCYGKQRDVYEELAEARKRCQAEAEAEEGDGG